MRSEKDTKTTTVRLAGTGWQAGSQQVKGPLSHSQLLERQKKRADGLSMNPVAHESLPYSTSAEEGRASTSKTTFFHPSALLQTPKIEGRGEDPRKDGM